MREYKIMLKLCNIAPDIRQVFKITGIDKVLDIHADASQAMEAFKKSGKLSFRKPHSTSFDGLKPSGIKTILADGICCGQRS